MKLVQPTFDLTLLCVRRYVEEGINHPSRALACDPLIVWCAPRAKVCLDPMPVQPAARSGKLFSQYTPHKTMTEWVGKYRAAIGHGEFTTSDFAEFLLGLGWQCLAPIQSASSKLKALYFKDVVEQVRREKRTFIYRFKQASVTLDPIAQLNGGAQL